MTLTQVFSILPTSEQLDILEKIAKILIDSKLYSVPMPKQNGAYPPPRDLTIPEAMAKILRGLPLGLTPSESLESLNMVRGKLTMGAALMGTLMKRAGYDWVTEVLTDTECKLLVYRNNLLLGVSSFSFADAQKANIVSDMYNKYPRNMLMARALSNAAKWFCQDAFGGSVYTPEELGDDKEAGNAQPIHNPRRLPVVPVVAEDDTQPIATNVTPINPATVTNPTTGEITLAVEPEPYDSDAAFDAIPSASGTAAPLTKMQLIRLQTLAKEVGMSDDERHILIQAFTQQRTATSKELTIAEADEFIHLLTIEKAGLALGEKWTEVTRNGVASSASNKRVSGLFDLHGDEIHTAHRKVAALAIKASVELPAALLPY